MRLFFVLLLFLLTVAGYSQTTYRNLDFEAALQAAKKENKLVMMVLQSATCKQCNEVAAAGIESAQVKEAADKNFVVIRSNAIPQELRSLILLPQGGYMGALFFDTERNLLRAVPGSTSLPRFYTAQMDTALMQLNSGGKTLNELKKEYFSSGSGWRTNLALVEKLISLRLDPAPLLLDDLVQKVPADSASSLSFLQFILRAAPLVNTEAAKYASKNVDNYNMAWYRMGLAERQTINRRIIDRSLAKAISDKDPIYMQAVAGYALTVNRGSTNAEDPIRASQQVQLNYYKEVKDTLGFIRTSVSYYDRYMNEKIEQIRSADSLYHLRIMKEAQPTVTQTGSVVRQAVMIGGPRAQYVSRELNNGAWTLYQFSELPVHVNKALSWAKRATEIYRSPENMDTYARLLYKTGNVAEAVEWEQQAIELAKTMRRNSSTYELVLANMKAGKNKID